MISCFIIPGLKEITIFKEALVFLYLIIILFKKWTPRKGEFPQDSQTGERKISTLSKRFNIVLMSQSTLQEKTKTQTMMYQ